MHRDHAALASTPVRAPAIRPERRAAADLLAGLPDRRPIEAQLRLDTTGRATWAWWPIEEQNVHHLAGCCVTASNPNQIARELGTSKSKAYRLRKQAADMPPSRTSLPIA